MDNFFESYSKILDSVESMSLIGKVRKIKGLLVESLGPKCGIGDLCLIEHRSGKRIYAEVLGLNGPFVSLMAYEKFDGIEVGDKVYSLDKKLQINLSDELLGRVIDSLGRPIDSKGQFLSNHYKELSFSNINPLNRGIFSEQIVTGIKVLDSFLPVAKGQRVGIFSGAGVGKSTLLGMIAKNSKADVNVIAFIGERGRELNEFIKYDLEGECFNRSVLIVSTSDETPISRYKGAYTATLIAEYFRDCGMDVMLLFDSITRFANAKREISLSMGEPPATKGYPPSVFVEIPILLERSGLSDKGSITGFYTVLVEGDDFTEPIADIMKATLDGHIILDRDLSDRGIYPSVNILSSTSRSFHRIVNFERQKLISKIRNLLSIYKNYEDLIKTGIYLKGSNKEVDLAISKYPKIIDFLSQGMQEEFDFEDLDGEIREILA
ncbi:Flagellum-specific ATP synthase [Borrelia miyamotoi]|uniref:FliI/YscN family ATPase n=1 Tax=Borrelia miyamotoi TaxID=47466 RepID=A0AAP9CFV5_9SPIR|nr:FliI/YscN family ATPase [Borrelia miyamotoi]ATQ14915.1 FliI/YscN family ATPase [Borrelia miyamotoi]ATQ16098.1 FliI/YscN family ATPase [Borrelia miyamotoi]ATQ17243.1 FliI/YscN family ATPase [Borrelia miyamotoi]ATQ18251.1 FliI/YscN family ATPase [Borrelia miyamotoi]ATQ19738.1 FliI/YscN family ATPase [Borrelia miyamotoi]